MLRWLMSTIFVNVVQRLVNDYQENKARGGGRGSSLGLLGRRIGALFIDWIPVSIVAAVVQAVLLGEPNSSVLYGSFATAFAPVVFLVVVVYFTLFEGYLGWTPGKYVAGVRVQGTEEEGAPGVQAAFIRSALRTVDGLMTYGVGLVIMLFSEGQQRRLGDRVAGTVTTGADSPLAGLGGSSEGSAMGATAFSSGGSLGGYAKDLTAQAKKGNLEPVIGREQEVKQVLRTLGRTSKNNPVLVGEAGVGKTAVAEGLARIAAGLEGEVPAALKKKKIMELDLTAIDSGTMYVGVFEERMEEIVQMASRPGVILFVDELHRLMTLGSNMNQSSPGAQILKPALARGDIELIGATTLDEYREIEKDPAMERRFQPITVPPLTAEATTEVLQRIRGKWESTGEVRIEEGAIIAAAPWAEKYLKGNLPDSAISLVDDAVSSARVESAGTVTEQDLSTVIEEQTGIKARSSGEDLVRLKKLEGELQQRVVGQDEAARTVSKTIQRRTALGDEKPASLLFLGPTGIGKTELAKALAESLFGSESEMIRLDMSEFQDQNMISRLTGASRGYKA